MSDEKPFAVKRYDATVDVPGCDCCGPSVDFREEADGDWVKIEDHNTAVAARERKAAANALREAASASFSAFLGGYADAVAAWLEARAAAIEGGAS